MTGEDTPTDLLFVIVRAIFLLAVPLEMEAQCGRTAISNYDDKRKGTKRRTDRNREIFNLLYVPMVHTYRMNQSQLLILCRIC